MIRNFALAASCALIATTAAAYADCAEELAALEDSSLEASDDAIAKDGSLAPLQEGEPAGEGDTAEQAATGQAPGAAEPEGEIAKDAEVAPLEGEPGGASADVAMSAQDAQAQQEGGETALAASEEGDEAVTEQFASREEALQGARDALAAADEDACMEAVEAAKAL